MKKIIKIDWKLFVSGIILFTSLASCSNRNESTTNENDLDAPEAMETASTTDGNNYYFSDWDANNDSYLDTDEYTGGFFHAWDTNKDSQLDENEWNTGYQRMGQSGLSWADWDLNADGFLNEGEYRTGNDKVGWYNAWDSDRDNRLSEDEYKQGMARNTTIE